MDINSLLSPSESLRTTPVPPAKVATKRLRGRGKSGSNLVSSYQPTSTTLPQPISAHSNNGIPQAQNATSTAPAMAAAQGFRSNAAVTPPTERLRESRQPSTPGMDALADLASMQHHQQTARVNAGGLRNTEIYDAQTTNAGTLPAIPAIPRPQGAPILRGTSFDRTMVDAPTQTPSPRQYTTGALPESEQEKVTQLAAHLAANPFAYDEHVLLINILHQGLLNHVRLNHSSKSPRGYDLLQELQTAREVMSSRFALGEDLLADWIQDQQALADTLEARISVMELCQKAIEEEPFSTKLWLMYAQWMLSLYKNANIDDERIAEIGPPVNGPAWSEEDRIVAREVFTWQYMVGVWQRGTQATAFMINDSQLIWDIYTELLLFELGPSPPREALSNIEKHFQNRLRIPHATWDQTFQTYSSFISKYDNANYEDTMITVRRDTRGAPQKYGFRDISEINLLRAQQANDRAAELNVFTDYIEYEAGLDRKKNHFEFDLLNALYQRASLRFPANTELWEAYVNFINEELTIHRRRNISAIAILEQATRHCPWSGNLWSQFLLAAEIEKMPFAAIGQIKHRATSTGLLDAGSMDEILKVHTAWCGFLRRRAFQEGATDEDADVAEVGIRSALEDMDTAGKAKYGKDFQGDPEFRLEKIYIKYLAQCRNWDGARDTYKKLVRRKGDSYDFWLRYYLWEMTTWSKLAFNGQDPHGGKFIKPTEAANVLQRALKRPNLDWPEKIIETFHDHCETHEDAAELQSAIVQLSKATKAVQRRRAKEADDAQAYQAAQVQAIQQQEAVPMELVDTSEGMGMVGKRKREDELHDGRSKRSREDIDNVEPQVQEQELSAPSALKRDRENSTVVVRNLPIAATETRVRQYFRDCGTINNLKLLPESDGKSATASIEFESKEDVLTAQTKDMKIFDGKAIEVQVGGGSTIYICNFPPIADESWIRKKFQQFGEIVDIRFPSLKYDTHRRFCYLQFKLASQAQAATQLDGEDQGDDLKMTAKISDPAHKQDRHGAIYEGRELYLANLDWKISEKEVKEAFSKYGKVEKVRIPKKFNGQSKGMGFVVFRSKDEATAALEMNLKKLHSRILNVSVSTNDKTQRQTNLVTSTSNSQRASNSPAPSNRQETPNGNGQNVASPTPSLPNHSSSVDIQSRTMALFNIPDTVNDARIRALAEPYGKLVKVLLRPDHSGAIIEYKDVASVGKASLGLEGHEISHGRLITVGTVGEMLKQKAEQKSDKPRDKNKNTSLQGPTPIRRPGQPARRGGKGGLGTKRVGVSLSGDRATSGGQGKEAASDGQEGDVAMNRTESEQSKGSAPKSNADFRDILLKK